MKRWYHLKGLFLLVVFLIITTLPSYASPDGGENSYVLIINSYTESNPWSRIFTAPVYEQMTTDDESWTAYTENMDLMLMSRISQLIYPGNIRERLLL